MVFHFMISQRLLTIACVYLSSQSNFILYNKQALLQAV